MAKGVKGVAFGLSWTVPKPFLAKLPGGVNNFQETFGQLKGFNHFSYFVAISKAEFRGPLFKLCYVPVFSREKRAPTFKGEGILFLSHFSKHFTPRRV